MRQSVIKLYTIVSEKDLDARQRKLVNQAGTILMSDRKMTAKELLMVQRQLATIKSDGEDESTDDENKDAEVQEDTYDYEQHPIVNDFGHQFVISEKNPL